VISQLFGAVQAQGLGRKGTQALKLVIERLSDTSRDRSAAG
jgi:hypothetical protein